MFTTFGSIYDNISKYNYRSPVTGNIDAHWYKLSGLHSTVKFYLFDIRKHNSFSCDGHCVLNVADANITLVLITFT